MKYSILFILCLTTFWTDAQTLIKIERNLINEDQCCDVEKMKNAYYEKSYIDTIIPIKNLSNNFSIIVDSNVKATNFISYQENYLREQSIELDTSAFKIVYLEKWNKLTNKKKIEFIKQKMLLSKYQADSIHTVNNQGQHQVWIINNTKDNISVQMQDGSYICVLQALTKDGKWTSIQNWNFSWCGNSYFNKVFKPQTANSFITTIPTKGDFETKLRYKLLGANEIYYSNEITGKINFIDISNK